MKRQRDSGGMKPATTGCAVLIILALGCALVSSLALQFAQRLAPAPFRPVAIEGACPPAEVQAFIDGDSRRLAEALGPLATALEDGEVGQDGRSIEEALQNLDMEEFQATRDRIAASDVPACAADLLAAELAMADDVFQLLNSFEECSAEGEPENCMTITSAWTAIRLPLHGKRLAEGYEALAIEAGLPVTDPGGRTGTEDDREP